MSEHHRYAAGDRGRVHVRRWTATCSCGWVSPHHRRRRKQTKRDHRDHLASLHRHGRAEPRCLTPPDRLPPELRPEESYVPDRP